MRSLKPTPQETARKQARKAGRFVISEQQLECMRYLYRYRYLRTNYVSALTGQSHSGTRNSLMKLCDHGLVDTPFRQPWGTHGLNNQNIYRLTKDGQTYLENTTELPYLAVPFNLHVRKRNDMHALMIIDFTASIEIAARDAFISFGEIMERNDLERLRLPVELRDPVTRELLRQKPFEIEPDNLMGFRHADGTASFFALEAEWSSPLSPDNLNRSSWRRKTIAYYNLVKSPEYKKQLNIPNLRTLSIFATDEKMKHRVEVTANTIPDKHNLFLFNDVPVQDYIHYSPNPFPEIYTDPWKRANLPDATIHAE